MFYLAYYLHWSQPDILDLPVNERWDYIRLLNEQQEREQESIEESRRR